MPSADTAAERVRSRAAELDANDSLRWTLERFAIPEPGLVYLDGNSLGRAPLASRQALLDAWDSEWADGLVRSWDGWFELPSTVGDLVGQVIGADPRTTVAADSTSVNLYKALHATLETRPGRTEILACSADFPTNRFVIEGVAAATNRWVRWLPELPSVAEGAAWDAFEAACGPDVAAVCFSLADYRTAAVCAGREISEVAHEVGAAVIWDLCHSAGAVDVDVVALRSTFAVGCTYKYLCGGPGSPGFIYCDPEASTDGRNPIRGWWSTSDQFDMDLPYRPLDGPRGYLTGSPPILALVAARPGIELAAACGREALSAKAATLTGFMVDALDALIDREAVGLAVRSPLEPARRTGHVAFAHENAWQICQALIARGVIGDFREPDILRLAGAPLSTSFGEVAAGMIALAEVLESGEWSEYPATKSRIT